MGLRKSKQREFVAEALRSNSAECIEWPFFKWANGYGGTSLDGFQRAHRLVYSLRNTGPVPAVVRHTCDNPSCVNPNHLVGGDVAANEQDKKDRARHVHGTRVVTAKLNPEAVAYIRSTHQAGARYPSEHSSRAIAEALGVSWPAVRKVLSGEQWARV